MSDKEEKKPTKAELEKELTEVKGQLEQLSAGYQAAINHANALNSLVNRYEETINVLTARLIEGRAQP